MAFMSELESSKIPQSFMTNPPPLPFFLPPVGPNNIANLVPVKLTRDNYFLWKSLFIPVLKAYDMFNIVDEGIEQCQPPQFLGNNSNPAIWVRKDQTCMMWIHSTLSESLLPYAIGAPSARALWLNLEKRFGCDAVTRPRVQHLKAQSQTLWKRPSMTMVKYLESAKQTADALAVAAGSPLDDCNFVAYILDGLPSEYDAFASAIRVRSDPPVTPEELHGLLLVEEGVVKKRSAEAGAKIMDDTSDPMDKLSWGSIICGGFGLLMGLLLRSR